MQHSKNNLCVMASASFCRFTQVWQSRFSWIAKSVPTSQMLAQSNKQKSNKYFLCSVFINHYIKY